MQFWIGFVCGIVSFIVFMVVITSAGGGFFRNRPLGNKPFFKKKKEVHILAIIAFTCLLAIGCNQVNANISNPEVNFSVNDLKMDSEGVEYTGIATPFGDWEYDANIEGNEGILDEGIYTPVADEWEGSFTVGIGGTEWYGSDSHIPSDASIVFTDSPESVFTIQMTPFTALTFGNEEGQSATVDFGGEEVTYSGDMPVAESAKMFFNNVLRLYKDMGCEANE